MRNPPYYAKRKGIEDSMKIVYESVKSLKTNFGKQGYSKKWIERTPKIGINEAIDSCQEVGEGFHSSCTV